MTQGQRNVKLFSNDMQKTKGNVGKEKKRHINVNKAVKCILSLPDILSLRKCLSNLSVIWRQNLKLMDTEAYHFPCLWLRTTMRRLMGKTCNSVALFFIILGITGIEWLHFRPLHNRRQFRCSPKPCCT